jgi:hypothetical protein
MPQLKSDLSITVRAGDKSFTLNCIRLPDHRFLVKRGRTISKKMPTATLSEIFDTTRKWAVNSVAQV